MVTQVITFAKLVLRLKVYPVIGGDFNTLVAGVAKFLTTYGGDYAPPFGINLY